MKRIRQSAAAVVFLTGLLSSVSAFATVINYDGDTVNLGLVANGQTGAVTNNFSGTNAGGYTFGNGNDYGFLPVNTEITFTYTFNTMVAGTVNSYGSYHYTQGNTVYAGNVNASSNGLPVAAGNIDSGASVPLVFASANVNPGLTVGTTSIINTSSSIAQFQSALSGLFGTNGRLVSVSYAVSSVPLPAALPMFAAVLAGLAGVSVMRKRRTI